MLIKVNQLTKLSHAVRWQSKMDIAGLCICRGDVAQPPWIPLDSARNLRSQLPGVRVSVALNPNDGFSAAEVMQIVADLHADYYEYTPVDFAKRAEFSAELNRIGTIGCSKIASGYFIQRDDCGFIDERVPYLEMMRAGVELFQFEVNSAVLKDFRLLSVDLQRAKVFFAEVPTLVSDAVSQLGGYPIDSTRGFFFNISPLPSGTNYDYSLMLRTEAEILRIVARR